MNKMARAAIIGGLVALAVSFGLSALMASAGAKPGIETTVLGGIIGMATFYILANLAGNKRAIYADEGTRQHALTLQPPAGQGLLVVFREGFVAKAAGMNVSLDGREIGQLMAPRFLALPMAPGAHAMQIAFGGLAGAQNVPADAPFDLKPGEVAVFRLTVSMGMMSNVIKLERVADLAQVRARLARMPMIAA